MSQDMLANTHTHTHSLSLSLSLFKTARKHARLLTYLLTYAMEQSRSSEANCFSACQEIPLIL